MEYEQRIQYAVMVDEPGALHRQYRIMVVSKEQYEAGVEALPDPKDVLVLDGDEHVYDSKHPMVERLHTMKKVITNLHEHDWLRKMSAAKYKGSRQIRARALDSQKHWDKIDKLYWSMDVMPTFK